MFSIQPFCKLSNHCALEDWSTQYYRPTCRQQWLGSSYCYSWWPLEPADAVRRMNLKNSSLFFIVIFDAKIFREREMKMFLTYYLCRNIAKEWKISSRGIKKLSVYRFSPFFKQRKAVVALLCFLWRLSDYFSYTATSSSLYYFLPFSEILTLFF